jgi:predicted aspartyl protease
MNTRLEYSVFLISLVCILLCWPPTLQAEFYRYVDEEGNSYFVDDISSVPEKYRDQIKVYREKYDNLSGDDRSRALQRENEEVRAKEQEHQRQIEERLLQTQQIEDEERRKQAEAARKKLQERSETRVILEGNRILIPVTFNNDGVELEVTLLLDTGASQIVLNRQVADQLNIVTLQKGLAQVAGGSSILTQLGKVSYVKVGPFKMEDAGVLIIPHEGAPVNYSGLLGMNFLKNVEYSIDYKNQVIRWKLPPGQSAASN